MSAAFGVGLVVGKFAPLHKGHVLVVEHAASLCRRVVVISYSSPELPGYEAERRETWLKACFPNATVLVLPSGSWDATSRLFLQTTRRVSFSASL